MQVPSRLIATVLGGASNFGRAELQSSSLAIATDATASATSWIRQRETARPWFSSRSIWTRGELNSAYLWEMTLANRGVELTTIRASRSNGQYVGPPWGLW